MKNSKIMFKNFTFKALIILIILALFSCQDDEIQKDSNTEIINDQKKLNERITQHQDTIFTSTDDESGRKVKHFRLILQASLLPPQIDGKTLQATSIFNHWGGFLVSYNYRGEEYLGGVDFIDSELVVQSEIFYRDADIHSLTAHDQYVYLTGARQGAENPAYVEKVLLNGMQFSLDENTVRHLGSYAATSTTYHDGNLFVTTGSDATQGGGLYQLDPDLNEIGYTALHDARWVIGSGNDIYVAQGTPGKISSFDTKKMKEKSSIAFDGATTPEAKTTIDVADNMIFVAAGTQGVHIFDEKNRKLLHSLTFGDGYVTNAVSAENGLLFISNGEHGAYVATYEENKKDAPVILGKIKVADHQSINHVLFRNNHLWIAAGLGGIHQVDLETW